GGTALVLRMPSALVPAGPIPGAAPAAAGLAPASAHALTAADVATATGQTLLAPLTGLYYKSPSPGAEPFVREGGEVHIGQVIGLIEAMKLLNEKKSAVAGRGLPILA